MGKEITVQLTVPERYYTKCYHDFMDCTLLNGEEKIVFLALKRFLDVKSEHGQVFPTIETIQDMTGWGKQKVIKYIKSLVKKGVVKKIRQGLSKPNIYILSDCASIWTCASVEEMARVAESLDADPSTAEVHSAKPQQIGYAMPAKEKELVSASDQTADTSTKDNNSLSKKDGIAIGTESQAERYSMKELKDFFEYSIMIKDYQVRKADLQAAFDILYEVLNTGKPTVRISGEDKPQAVVAGKLMKLTRDDILYAIDKFHEQTGEIKNTRAYLLTILYHAKDQAYLDLMNLGHRNGHF